MTRIEPLPLPADITPNAVSAARPRLIEVACAQLHVDARYQRGLSEKGVRLIHRIVGDWDWKRYKPPIVCAREGEPDAFDVLDGQHTAIAAATHGGVGLLPVMLVEADSLTDKAKAFLGHNRDRIGMQATQLLHSGALAGDEDDQNVLKICERAGVTILKLPPANGRFKPGETLAVAVIRRLARQRTAQQARIVLEACARSGAAPVSADMIKAAHELMHGRDYAGEIMADDLAVALAKLRDQEARVVEMAAAKKLPRWRAMTIVAYQLTRKRRAA